MIMSTRFEELGTFANKALKRCILAGSGNHQSIKDLFVDPIPIRNNNRPLRTKEENSTFSLRVGFLVVGCPVGIGLQ